MAGTPITPILQEIDEMQKAFVQPSCEMDQEPMMKYPDSGTPPVLSFNIPQSTVFNTYGKIAVPLNEDFKGYFRPFTKNIPKNNYWSVIDNMTPDQLFQLMNPYVANTAPVMAYMPLSLPHSPVATPAHLVGKTINKNMAQTQSTAHAAQQMDQPVLMQPVSAPKSSLISDYAVKGLRPIFMTRLSGAAPITKYVVKPPEPIPMLFVIEEYTTGSYLGDYGAGRVVKTFSLLPGERTTITVRTYKDMESKRESAQNMLDSFSQSSADELDKLIQHEDGNMESTSDTSSDSSSNFATHTDASNSTRSLSLSANLSFANVGVSGGYGMSQSDAASNASGWNNATTHGHTGARQSNVSNLNNALSKHVQQSNANRQININTSTSDIARSGEEDTTVRYIENYNKSRVLNFTFRQLLQEYMTITSLTNLKFVYTNGYPESFTMVDLNNLDNMLVDIIKDGDPLNPDPVKAEKEYYRDQFRCLLLRPYCTVMDYEGVLQPFLSRKKIDYSGCEDAVRIEDWSFQDVCGDPAVEYFWRIVPDLHQTYDADPPNIGGMNLRVPGIILSAKKQTLQTSSVIADALMGRGQALDCFNQKAQEADNMADFIANVSAMQRVATNVQVAQDNHDTVTQQLAMGDKQIDKMQKDNDAIAQQIAVITGITDPADKAVAYKKVFGSCCPTPQFTGGCGCGGGCDDKA